MARGGSYIARRLYRLGVGLYGPWWVYRVGAGLYCPWQGSYSVQGVIYGGGWAIWPKGGDIWPEVLYRVGAGLYGPGWVYRVGAGLYGTEGAAIGLGGCI